MGVDYMISFFLAHAPAFLTIGVSVIGATLLRTAAQIYADKGTKDEVPAANKD